MFKSAAAGLLFSLICTLAVIATRGQGTGIANSTSLVPLRPRIGRPQIQPGRVLPPKESKKIYLVDTRKSVLRTAIEATDFACGKSALCNSTLGKYDRSTACFSCRFSRCRCDENCHQFGDCCADKLYDGEKGSPRRWLVSSSDMTCLLRLPKESNRIINLQDRILMVSRCPSGTIVGDVIISKCEQADIHDIEQATLVSVPGSPITYRNQFCAQCFGVLDFVPWTYKVKCDVGSSAEKATSRGELWELVLNDAKCSITNSPPVDVSLRNCMQPRLRLIHKCNETGNWENFDNMTQFICDELYQPVVYSSRVFKNIFCAICNGIVLDRNQVCFTSNSDIRPSARIIPQSLPLSVLIDFNAQPKSSPAPTGVTNGNQCDRDESYDPFIGSCRQLQCPPRRILTDGQCEPIYKNVQGLGYSFSMVVKPGGLLNLSLAPDLTGAFTEYLRGELKSYEPFVFPELLFQPFAKLDGTLTGISVSGDIVSTSDRNMRDLEHSLKTILKFSLNVTLNGDNISLETNPILCSSTPEQLLEGQPGFGIERLENAGYKLSRGCFHNCFAGVDYLPVSGILDCAFLEFNLSESSFSYDAENLSLTLDNLTLYLNDSGHYFCGESLSICSDDMTIIQTKLDMPNTTGTPDSADPEAEVDIAMTIVSIVCIALSLICLLITFIIYCILQQLRTLPGKNTMALIFHLFCAQLIFQVGIALTHNQTLCQILGVLIHYFWLTTFAWMALSAYQMCSVFSNMTANRFYAKTGEWRTIIRSLIISNIYATVFIGSCIAYRLGTSDGTNIGYGGAICFLQQSVDVGIFFAVPLGLVLIFNTVCFVKTVISIRGVPDMKSAKNKSNKNHMLVYFRLSILLGFAWIFGFIAAAIQTPVLWYVFIILNGLQGVFIFVAYCVNKRTWTMLKTRLRGKAEVKYSPASRSSSAGQHTYSTTL